MSLSDITNYPNSPSLSCPTNYKGEKEDSIFLYSPPVDTNSESILVPGGNEEENRLFFQSLNSKNDENQNGFLFQGAFAGLSDLLQVRDQYLSDMNLIKQEAEKLKYVPNKNLALKFISYRNFFKDSARSKSLVPVSVYNFMDRIRGKERLFSRKFNLKLDPGTLQRLNEGEFATIIKKASQGSIIPIISNPKVIKISSSLFKAYNKASTIVVAFEVPYSMYNVYTAKTHQERINSWKDFGSAVGTMTNITMCVALGVGTGGFGFLACGLLPIASGIYVGKAAGLIAEKVYSQETEIKKSDQEWIRSFK
ncbi:hypothetical protein [Reichenbachiella sp.]|uniref:hypothetical protein n=1 Tax=Reichenbachiella sp. TaxID=2184521 RepID=UPI003296D92C